MSKSLMVSAYAKVSQPLWVTPFEARDYLISERFQPDVVAEISDWFARKLSMQYVAGFRGLTQPLVVKSDMTRQLAKMGFAQLRALEIVDYLVEMMPKLYLKGCSHRDSGYVAFHF